MISIQLFLGQSFVSININSPIGKLLALINQSFTLFTNLLTGLKKLIGFSGKYMELTYLPKNHVFVEEDNFSSKIVTMEEELDAVEVDRIGNLVKFID